MSHNLKSTRSSTAWTSMETRLSACQSWSQTSSTLWKLMLMFSLLNKKRKRKTIWLPTKTQKWSTLSVWAPQRLVSQLSRENYTYRPVSIFQGLKKREVRETSSIQNNCMIKLLNLLKRVKIGQETCFRSLIIYKRKMPCLRTRTFYTKRSNLAPSRRKFTRTWSRKWKDLRPI